MDEKNQIEILHNEISRLGEETGDDRPFYKGVMFVESRKPETINRMSKESNNKQ